MVEFILYNGARSIEDIEIHKELGFESLRESKEMSYENWKQFKITIKIEEVNE